MGRYRFNEALLFAFLFLHYADIAVSGKLFTPGYIFYFFDSPAVI
jgi:hypothetical protein